MGCILFHGDSIKFSRMIKFSGKINRIFQDNNETVWDDHRIIMVFSSIWNIVRLSTLCIVDLCANVHTYIIMCIYIYIYVCVCVHVYI